MLAFLTPIPLSNCVSGPPQTIRRCKPVCKVEPRPRPSYPPAQRQLVESRPVQRSYEYVLDSVLKVFCTHSEPNYEVPWAMTAQRHSTSSAFVISGRRILTNAHSVEHHVSVRVKKRYLDTKYTAKVLAIGNECDIALLEVEDEEFWEDFEDRQCLVPGPLPQLQDAVLVVGYPTPGNQISVTAGVCSRVEMQQYVHGQGELLAVQIDAAVRSMNFPFGHVEMTMSCR